MNLRSVDLWGGLLLFCFGSLGIYGAWQLDLGSARNMGPGYFPMMAAIAIAVCGVVVLALAVASRDLTLWALDWGPLLSVSLSGIVFGLLVSRAGLIPAILGCIIVATLADRRLGVATTLALCVGLGILAYLIFQLLLGLSIPAFRVPRWT